eukprot:2519968-Pyramimonas_sp.AAC.1
MAFHRQERKRGATVQKLKPRASAAGTTRSALIDDGCKEGGERSTPSVRELPQPAATRILFTDRKTKFASK